MIKLTVDEDGNGYVQAELTGEFQNSFLFTAYNPQIEGAAEAVVTMVNDYNFKHCVGEDFETYDAEVIRAESLFRNARHRFESLKKQKEGSR